MVQTAFNGSRNGCAKRSHGYSGDLVAARASEAASSSLQWQKMPCCVRNSKLLAANIITRSLLAIDSPQQLATLACTRIILSH